MDETLHSMFDCLSHGDATYLPSRLWEELNTKNLQQLETSGLDNIKQTVAQNYFTWVIGHSDQQFRYLARHTKLSSWPAILRGIFDHDPSFPLNRKQQRELKIFTRMLWKFTERIDSENLLAHIEEPIEGNPFRIFLNGKLISQDLANSVLEYYSICEHFTASTTSKDSICELGAGYGRNAYVFVKALTSCKYIVIDIPPALYVSQHYLTNIFPEKRIFTFRPFRRFSDVEKEFNDADLAFVLPHQAEMLPEKSVDLFINISSLHEMRKDQIDAYFTLIEKLTRGYFYTKQWWVSQNPADGITITPKDYPVPRNWTLLYLRKAMVQTYFFEAMYALGRGREL